MAAPDNLQPRFRYVYNVGGDGTEPHPKMGSPCWLLPWLLLGALSGPTAISFLLNITDFAAKIGELACFFMVFPLTIVNSYWFGMWCFPPILPILGSTRKFILQILALHAAILLKYFITHWRI
ncbi:hypothetical protein LINPERHAP2_LOCUS23828 [Linum perenne]